MDYDRLQRIIKFAEVVRQAIDLSNPLDVKTAVRKLGGTIKTRKRSDYEAKIEKTKKGFKIVIREDIFKKRKRFSIAHELGHLFLHMGYLIDNEKWAAVGPYTDSVYYRYGHKLEEHEADTFANSFLMPKSEFIKIAQKYYDEEKEAFLIHPIAEYFDVSLEAAVNQGKWLGLFRWDWPTIIN